jgi:hypothetical protein
VPRIGPPSKIVQNAREVVFLYDDVNGAFFRIIPTDGRPHRKDVPASYLGDAIARIEGDTLIVETVGFNEDTWLTDNGAFHTKDLKVTERFRRVGDTIEWRATVQDPSILVEPWSLKPQVMWITDIEIEEPARCEDRDVEHIIDGSHHDNPGRSSRRRMLKTRLYVPSINPESLDAGLPRAYTIVTFYIPRLHPSVLKIGVLGVRSGRELPGNVRQRPPSAKELGHERLLGVLVVVSVVLLPPLPIRRRRSRAWCEIPPARCYLV